MNTGEVSELTVLRTKTIRYYEDIGLVRPLRAANGYRDFRDSDRHKLAFLGRARALGFSIEDCRTLLALWEDDSRESAQVKLVATEHLRHIDEKIAQLQSLRDTLAYLVNTCAGDDRPDCPILSTISTTTARGAVTSIRRKQLAAASKGRCHRIRFSGLVFGLLSQMDGSAVTPAESPKRSSHASPPCDETCSFGGLHSWFGFAWRLAPS